MSQYSVVASQLLLQFLALQRPPPRKPDRWRTHNRRAPEQRRFPPDRRLLRRKVPLPPPPVKCRFPPDRRLLRSEVRLPADRGLLRREVRLLVRRGSCRRTGQIRFIPCILVRQMQQSGGSLR